MFARSERGQDIRGIVQQYNLRRGQAASSAGIAEFEQEIMDGVALDAVLEAQQHNDDGCAVT